MFIKTLIWLGVLLTSRFIKLSLLLGSVSSISVLHVTAPLSATLFHGFNGLFFIAGLTGLHFLFPIIPLKLGLPTLAATLSLTLATNPSDSFMHKISNIMCNILLPAVCIMLFTIHHIGSVSWVYSLYWLIPMCIAFIKTPNLFLSALQSTFIAHAVGSIIWLYTVPMTPAQWFSLIPLVAVERCTLASLMTVGNAIIIALTPHLQRIQRPQKTNSVKI